MHSSEPFLGNLYSPIPGPKGWRTWARDGSIIGTTDFVVGTPAITNVPNGWAEGTYTATYFVTDGGGNTSAPVTRTVEAVDCPW